MRIIETEHGAPGLDYTKIGHFICERASLSVTVNVAKRIARKSLDVDVITVVYYAQSSCYQAYGAKVQS